MHRSLVATVIALLLVDPVGAACTGAEVYDMEFIALPVAYSALAGSPPVSPVAVGAAHKSTYTLFEDQMAPSAGIQQLMTAGQTTDLLTELLDATRISDVMTTSVTGGTLGFATTLRPMEDAQFISFALGGFPGGNTIAGAVAISLCDATDTWVDLMVHDVLIRQVDGISGNIVPGTSVGSVVLRRQGANPCTGSANYEVTLQGSWLTDVPLGGGFEGLLSTTHDATYQVFQQHRTVSPDVSIAVTTGDYTDVTNTLRTQQANQGSPIRSVTTLTTMVSPTGVTDTQQLTADAQHTLLTTFSRLGGTIDAMVGLNSVQLCPHGEWLTDLTFPLYGYDAGTQANEPPVSRNALMGSIGEIRIHKVPVADPVVCEGQAVYDLDFMANWQPPWIGTGTGSFFGLAGGSHSSEYTLFQEGGQPSMALSALAGSTTVEGGGDGYEVLQQFRAAAPATGSPVSHQPLPGVTTQGVRATFVAFPGQTRVSLVAKPDPSPDWFAGIRDLDLCDRTREKWREVVRVRVSLYDAGTDQQTSPGAAKIPLQEGQSPRISPLTRSTPGVYYEGVAAGQLDTRVGPVGEVVFRLRKPRCTGTAQYKVEFTTSRSAANNHPMPTDPTTAVFSSLWAAVHNTDYVLWESSLPATPAFTQFATSSGTALLDEERTTLSDHVDPMATGGIPQPVTDLGASGATVSTVITVTPQFDMLSVGSVMLPSTDWFVGLSQLDLCPDSCNEWVDEWIEPLFPLDAGTDVADSSNVVGVLGAPFDIPNLKPVATFRVRRIHPFSDCTGTATYKLTWTGMWEFPTHPLPDGATMSDLMGVTHSPRYSLWQPCGRASDGVARMAEQGLQTILADEIAASRTTTDTTFTTPVQVMGMTSTDFKVRGSHSLVSLMAGLQPSPDWFLGVRSVPLCGEHAQWVDRLDFTLTPFDAGSDSGPRFDSPNEPTTPQSVVTPITTATAGSFFDATKNGAPLSPLATLSLELIEIHRCKNPAQYQVDFMSTWDYQAYPISFAHFSPLSVVVHTRGYEMFHIGSEATPAMELLAERGNPIDLLMDAEADKPATVLDTYRTTVPSAAVRVSRNPILPAVATCDFGDGGRLEMGVAASGTMTIIGTVPAAGEITFDIYDACDGIPFSPMGGPPARLGVATPASDGTVSFTDANGDDRVSGRTRVYGKVLKASGAYSGCCRIKAEEAESVCIFNRIGVLNMEQSDEGVVKLEGRLKGLGRETEYNVVVFRVGVIDDTCSEVDTPLLGIPQPDFMSFRTAFDGGVKIDIEDDMMQLSGNRGVIDRSLVVMDAAGNRVDCCRVQGRSRIMVEVTPVYDMVSVASMVAPSPDWFVGLRGIDLCPDDCDEWTPEVVIPLNALDAGTDSGTDFPSTDIDTQPRGVITEIAQFSATPFAAVRLRRVMPREGSCSTTAEYNMKVTTAWTANAGHPVPAVPPYGFSAFLGVSHQPSFRLWECGDKERLTKLFAGDPVVDDYYGGVSYLSETGGALPVGPEAMVEGKIRVPPEQWVVSGVLPLVPSPDWFLGFRMMDLCDREEGEWRHKAEVPMVLYDAGSREGTTFQFSLDASPAGTRVNPITPNRPPTTPWTSSIIPPPLLPPLARVEFDLIRASTCPGVAFYTAEVTALWTPDRHPIGIPINPTLGKGVIVTAAGGFRLLPNGVPLPVGMQSLLDPNTNSPRGVRRDISAEDTADILAETPAVASPGVSRTEVSVNPRWPFASAVVPLMTHSTVKFVALRVPVNLCGDDFQWRDAIEVPLVPYMVDQGTMVPTGAPDSALIDDTPIPTPSLPPVATIRFERVEPYRAAGIRDPKETNAPPWIRFTPTTTVAGADVVLTFDGFRVAGTVNDAERIEAKIGETERDCQGEAVGGEAKDLDARRRAVFRVFHKGIFRVCVRHRRDWEPVGLIKVEPPQVDTVYFGATSCQGFLDIYPQYCGCWFQRNTGDKTFTVPTTTAKTLVLSGPTAASKVVNMGCCSQNTQERSKIDLAPPGPGATQEWGFCSAKKIQPCQMTAHTIVLVHGAWEGGWIWQGVEALLTARGHNVLVVDLPHEIRQARPTEAQSVFTSLVEAVVQGVTPASAQVVLVGHHWGGTVVRQVALRNPNRVKAVVHVGSLLVGAGSVPLDSVDPLAPGWNCLQRLQCGGMTPLCGLGEDMDCEASLSNILRGRLVTPVPDTLFQQREGPLTDAIKQKSYYVVTTEDPVLPAATQKQMSMEHSMESIMLEEGHLPMLTAPQRLAAVVMDVLCKAA